MPFRFLLGLLRVVLLAAWLPVLAVASLLVLYHQAFEERVYPGVVVGDVGVGGYTLVEARGAVQAHVERVLGGPLPLRYGDIEVHTTLGDLGVGLAEADAAALAEQAWRTGRAPGASAWLREQLRLWKYGARLPLRLALHPDHARWMLTRLAQALDQPAASARLEIERTDTGLEVRTSPASAGRRLNVDATVDRLQRALEGGVPGIPAVIDLVVEPVEPAVTDTAVGAAHDAITRLTARPVTFVGADGRTWTLAPAALLDALHVTGLPSVGAPAAEGPLPDGAAGAPPQAVEVQVDEARLRALVLAVCREADEPAHNPRLEVQDLQVVVRPGKAGRLVDCDAAVQDTLRAMTADAADAAGPADGRTVRLRTVEDRPSVEPHAAAAAAAWANARLAAPLALEHAGQHWTVERRDLVGFVALPDTQAVPRRAGGVAPRMAPAGPALGTDFDREKVRAFLERWVPGWVGYDPALAPVDAALEVRDGRVEIVPERLGVGVDFDALAEQVVAGLRSLDPARRTIPVRIVPRPPRLTAAHLAAARAAALRLVGRPIVVRWPAGEAVITPEELLPMLKFQRTPDGVLPYLGRGALIERVEALARQVDAAAAKMGWRDAAGRPWRMDVLMTAAEVWAQAQTDEREVEVYWSFETAGAE